MLCVRSGVPCLSSLLKHGSRLPSSNLVRFGGNVAAPWRPNGEMAKTSLHADIPAPQYKDEDRLAGWRGQTDAIDRNASNNMPQYMVIGAGTGVILYLAKYALYGAVLLLGPGRDKYAAAAIEVDLSTIPEGKNAVFTWRGKPLFIRHRTSEEINAAKNADISQFRDPQTDAERCQNEKFLICLGVCTHLGCVPIAHAGDWKGYYCPCHGSHYDTSARIMKGPAPLNLEVPAHEFIEEHLVIIGKAD